MLSVVVPIFNEEDNINELYLRLNKVLKNEKIDFEIIFINDGSEDNSLDILLQIAKRDNNVVVLDFGRNFGQHKAVAAGIDFAKGDAILIIDADLQNPPEEIPKLLTKYEEGYDVVYGKRKVRHDSFWRKIFSKFAKLLFVKFINKDSFYSLSAFRIMKSNRFKDIVSRGFDFGYVDYYANVMGYSTTFVEVKHDKRKAGASHYNLFDLIRIFIKMLLDYTTLPLIFSIYIGIFTALSGFLWGMYLIVQRLLNHISVSGYTSMMVALLLLFGILFIIIGIVGLYLGKIFQRQKGEKLYYIKKVYKYGKNGKT